MNSDETRRPQETSEWGQGERGVEGNEDSGESELYPPSAGQPGPADETPDLREPGEQAVAGRPGPADETDDLRESDKRSVAGRRGPADETA